LDVKGNHSGLYRAGALVAAMGCLATLQAPVAATSAVMAADKRLDKPVSARVMDVPLKTWLEQLGRATGVTLRTAPEYEDRSLTVRVANMPLRDVMDALASLYGDLWHTSKQQDGPAYTLESAFARRQRQWLLLLTYRQTLEKELTRTIQENAERGPQPWQYAGGAFETDADRAHFLAELKARGELITALGPGAIGYLLRGGTVRFRATDVEGKLGEAFWRFLETHAMPASTGWKPETRASAWIQFTAEPYSLSEHAYGLPLRRVMFVIGVPGGRTSAYGLVVHPDEFAVRLRGELAAAQRQELQAPQERRTRGGEALQRRLSPGLKLTAGTPATRSELLVALAESANLNLLSDSYLKPPIPAPAVIGNTVEEALSSICDTYNASWRVEHEGILVRSAWWWIDDMHEPPASAVAQWQAALAERGFLTLDETSRISALSPEQQQRLRLRLPETHIASNPWLQLYSRLDPSQRRAALSPQGLELWKVPEARRFDLTRRDPVNNPFTGVQRVEEALDSGNATLLIDTNTRLNDRPAVLIRMKPLPDRAGHIRGVSQQNTLPLPYREPTLVGRDAPLPPLMDLEGRSHTLAEFRGKPLVVTFFAPGCEECSVVAPRLEKEYWQKLRDHGLRVVGISTAAPGDAIGGTRDFIAKNGITYPVFLDGDGKAAAAFGVRALPTNIVIDSGGKLRWMAPGMDLAGIDKALPIVTTK
jgi:peroxiredoxin